MVLKLLMENVTVVAGTLLVILVVGPYLLLQKRGSKKVKEHIAEAKRFGLHEPVTIHPKVNRAICIGSGACITACPEKGVLGMVENKSETVYASRCVGHGACARACPVGAIELVFGTEKRGVDIPQVFPNFESNVKGIFIAGELGGMGLIRNAMTQGQQAVGYINSEIKETGTEKNGVYDLVIVGAGPAGIAAGLKAKANRLNFLLLDQEEDFGGAILSYPRAKVVLTKPVEVPLYGKVKTGELSKEELLRLWRDIVKKTGLTVHTKQKVVSAQRTDSHMKIVTSDNEEINSKYLLLTIGRRGTPRKLGVPGEKLPKVTYRLIEPEQYEGQNILVVGGGDSAVETAMALSEQKGAKVAISYRGNAFSRIKPANMVRINRSVSAGWVKLFLESNVIEIKRDSVILEQSGKQFQLTNDSVFVMAGGVLPNEFLRSCGIQIQTKFGTR